MGQTKIGSLVEAITNIIVGFGVNFAANIFVLPLFGFTSLNLTTAFHISLVFTIISLARSYLVRRVFNYRMIRNGRKLTEIP